MHYFQQFSNTTASRLNAISEAQCNALSSNVILIASTCYPFPQALQALAEPSCVFPIEGLPDGRYFPGTAIMDDIETKSQKLLRKLFNIDGAFNATIQPHSGTQANQMVFNAVLGPNDKVLSLNPSDGGHISHKVLVGRRNTVVQYGVGADGQIDLNQLTELAHQHRPILIIAGSSSYPRQLPFERISRVAKEVGAFLHADISHTATFLAADLHQPVFPHADFVTFNMVKNLRGPNGGVLIYRSDLEKRVSGSVFPGTQGGPNENTLLGKYAALSILSEMNMRDYAQRMIDLSNIMAVEFMSRDIDVVTGGSDCHLLLLDLRNLDRTGLWAEQQCESYQVLVNRNFVPGDQRSPSITSGLRLGTACIRILQYSESDVRALANWIADRLHGINNDDPQALVTYLVDKYNHSINY